MKVYSNTDPDVKPYLQRISKYAQQAQVMNLPYWIFVQDENPIGIIAVGKEPIQLLASPGTLVALINLIDAKQPRGNIEVFAKEALDLAIQKNAEYALAGFRFNEETAIYVFQELGFKEFDDCYQMVCQLDKDFRPSADLQFVGVKKEEMRQFIAFAEIFLQGSPDVTLTEALKHFHELPDEFLSLYYSLDRFYLVKNDKEVVGVLDFNPNSGLISNIGVASQLRGKGYGKQIMLFALEQLNKSGCKKAFLRVHVENKTAIHLYESLGFVKAERYKRLIWRKRGKKV